MSDKLDLNQKEDLLLSIIIPTKEDQLRLGETVSSINEQVLGEEEIRDIEFVIVNGGSVLRITQVDLNQDLRMTEVKDDGKGIYEAMNVGITHSAGKWLYFLNCGDRLDNPESLRRLISELKGEGTERASLVSFRYRRDEGKVENNPFCGSKWWGDYLLYGVVCHQAVVFRRDVLETQKGYSTKYRFVSDKRAIIRALRNGARSRSSRIVIAKWQVEGYCSQNRGGYEKEVRMVRSEIASRDLKSRLIGLTLLYCHILGMKIGIR